jgi:hypothetical protein
VINILFPDKTDVFPDPVGKEQKNYGKWGYNRKIREKNV